MHELPAGPCAAAAWTALPGAVVRDAVADPVEAAELLDVEVDQLAGVVALVAADRLGRLQSGEAIEAKRLGMRLTVAGETPTSRAI